MNTFASKIALVILTVFCVSTLSANTFAQSISNVSVKLVPITSAPEVRYTSSLPLPVLKSRVTNHWQAIVIEYVPKYVSGNKAKGVPQTTVDGDYSSRLRQFLDNVEVKVRVLCETDGPKATEQYALFTGSCKLWYIKLDGQRHTIVFFVPPWMLDRYFFPHRRLKAVRSTGSKAQPGKVGSTAHQVAKNDLSVEVTFNVNNSVIASGYLNVIDNKKTPGKVSFGKKVEKVLGGRVFEGAVLSLRQSPWAYSDINLFDPEKPETAK